MKHAPFSITEGISFYSGRRVNTDSMWWFSRLPAMQHNMLRYFMTIKDLGKMQASIPFPPVPSTPAFLVSYDGWVVDWFLPETPTESSVDEQRYVSRIIQDRLHLYQR